MERFLERFQTSDVLVFTLIIRTQLPILLIMCAISFAVFS